MKKKSSSTASHPAINSGLSLEGKKTPEERKTRKGKRGIKIAEQKEIYKPNQALPKKVSCFGQIAVAWGEEWFMMRRLNELSLSPGSLLYITEHLLPSGGWFGFWDFSTSPMIRSNALATLSLSRALASVQAQLNSSASFFPSSGVIWRSSGLRSLLLPTMTSGTHSEP